VRIAIVGQGYVGTSLGVAALSAGHEVVGVEINNSRLHQLKQEVSYHITSDFDAANNQDVVIIAVPTPLDSTRQPDLTFLYSACRSLAKSLTKGTLIVNESTSYPGTLRNIIAPTVGNLHSYASAPERVDPGNKHWNIKNTPRLIAGLTESSTQSAINFYKTFCSNVIPVSTPEVVEAAKLLENTFRQVNIALVNEFSKIAHALNISAYEVVEAAATKPYGFMPFFPSVGVGGHCIPVDPIYLSYVANQLGTQSRFVELADEINSSMPATVAKRIESILGGSLQKKRIQVVGIAYKADTNDIRESPSIELIKLLRKMGADVIWHDPMIERFEHETSQEISIVDLGVVATSHSNIDYSLWREEGIMVIDVSVDQNSSWVKLL
jgi:UDP-N-acetyl-D-glucosamine dehydrogenase